MTATFKIAHAAGRDAGNRSARRAGRTRWSEDDFNAAARVMEQILATISEIAS